MADSLTHTSRKINQIPVDLLNDLSSRFIINVPEEERVDLIRICFQIELAHWFYLDFYCDEDATLPKCQLKDFIRIIFGHIPFLQKYSSTVDSIIADWREYKMAVPTFGAILLDHSLKNVLLVQSFVFKGSWGFPKGKVNKDELPHHCAVREVLEETGFDISDLIDKDEYLEHHFNDQLIRLYIITGIPSNVKFHPRTRKEIKSIEWFPVNQLPMSKKDQVSKSNLGSINSFMVIPFVKQLRKWIANKTTTFSKDVSSENSSKSDSYLLQQHLFAKLSQTELAKYREINPARNSNSPTDGKITRNSNKGNSLPPRLLQQKSLKQSIENEENDLSRYKEAKQQAENSSVESRPSRTVYKGYSPPPRMLRQRNMKQTLDNDKKRNIPIQNEDKVSSKNFRRVLDFSTDMYPRAVQGKCNARKDVPYSKTWTNFSLDSDSLIATFSMNLR